MGRWTKPSNSKHQRRYHQESLEFWRFDSFSLWWQLGLSIQSLGTLCQTTLDKLEAIPEQAGYVLRYERGTFQSGYCILESKKVVVLNKFLATEGRINTLIDLIPQLQIDPGHLSEESARLHEEVLSRVESAEKPE